VYGIGTVINQDGFEGRGEEDWAMGLGFLDHMRVIPDHRIPGMVSCPLDEILLATLTGAVCGADDWEGIEEVANGALD
jgi:DDE_Tnp_1-associated